MKMKQLALLGVATTCWSLWLRRNDIIFKKNKFSPLQVTFIVTHWLHICVVLPEACLTGFACGGFAAFDIGAQCYPFLVTWAGVDVAYMD